MRFSRTFLSVLFALLCLGFAAAGLAMLFIPQDTLTFWYFGHHNDYIGRFLRQYGWFEQALWNTGHLFLFAILALGLGWLLKKWQQLPSLSVTYALAVFGLLLLLGVLIEFAQVQIGRSFSYSDILLDSCGAAAGLSVLLAIRPFNKALLCVLCFSIGLIPLFQASVNLYQMHRDFPVLFDNPSQLALKRFETSKAVVKTVTVQDSERLPVELLAVELGTEGYSVLKLKEMVRDWRGYKRLVIEWDNTSDLAFDMICRVHDKHHILSGNATQDRFHQRVRVMPGSNRHSFNLVDIAKAPKKREMDMSQIAAVLCFSFRLTQPRTLLVKTIYLE